VPPSASVVTVNVSSAIALGAALRRVSPRAARLACAIAEGVGVLASFRLLVDASSPSALGRVILPRGGDT
jgi:hypothetical protein